MKTKCVATIISLSPGTHSVIESAVAILNSVSQDAFAFELGGSMDLPPSPTPETPRLSSELGAVLFGERKRRQCELLVAVLNEPIENNWFSRAAYGKDVAWITAHDWELYSDLPVVNFLAYDIVLNVVLLRLVAKPEDEAWLMGEVIHTKESRECLSDLCVYKPDISRKMRSGQICADCRKVLAARMGTEALAAISTLLQAISMTAHPTKPTTSVWGFPGRKGMLKTILSVVAQSGLDVGVRQARTSERNDEVALSLRELVRQVEDEYYFTDEFSGATASFSVDRPGLAEQVESGYPFPIAYCFRSMRAELNPTDRWEKLFELYGLIVRYLVFALLNGLRHQQTGCPQGLKPLIQKLKFGYAGDWGKACIALLKHWQKSGKDRFFARFLRTVSAENLGQFETASKSLVQTRNSLEHGFKGDKHGCQTIFERHVPDVKNMLRFIGPLADYILIRPVQIVDNLDGRCIYFSKIMAGSDPQFLAKPLVSWSVPETVCQLLSPEGITLSLHPWMHLNYCHSCLREMVFVYDAIHMKDGKETVLLREYPSNHEQRQPTLLPQVKKLLSV